MAIIVVICIFLPTPKYWMCLSNREYVSCFQNLSNIILINPCCNELLYQAIFWLLTRHAWNLCDKEATCADWKGNVFPLDYTTGLGSSHRYSLCLCLCLSLHFCLASACSTEGKEIISSTVDWTIIPIVCSEKCDIWGKNLLLNITILFEHQRQRAKQVSRIPTSSVMEILIGLNLWKSFAGKWHLSFLAIDFEHTDNIKFELSSIDQALNPIKKTIHYSHKHFFRHYTNGHICLIG